jgi:ribose 5-phosphate isomerase A
MTTDDEKRLAAQAAADLVQDGMAVGLGTGTTVTHLLDSLASVGRKARFVTSSPRTAEAARSRGLVVDELRSWTRLDLVIDGADQIAEDGWVAKGAGGAITREKILIASSDRTVLIADSTKMVTHLRGPVALELLRFGVASTLARLQPARLRDGEESPDGGLLADYDGDLRDPGAVARKLDATSGVIEHGLVAPGTVSLCLVGSGTRVERLTHEVAA